MRLQFGLEAYQHRAKSIAAQRIQNCYLEKTPMNANNPIALLGVYGIEDFATPGNGPLRGGIVINGIPYVVSGHALYQVDETGSSTLLGQVLGADIVTMAGDGSNLAIASEGHLYVWNGTAVSQVTDPDFPGADWVRYIGTYFVVGIDGLVYISASFDPTSWNALDFISAETSPDDIVGAIVEKGELFAGGKDTIQAFYVSDSEIPLDRVPSGIAELGLLSRHAFAKIDNSVFFAATDFTVRRMEGYSPAVVSTPFISQLLEDLADKTVYAMTFTEGGHNFYALTSAEWTYVYDCSTQLWHQRKSYGLPYWSPLFALTAFDKVLVGHRGSNKLGALSPSVYTEWGDPIQMVGTCRAVDADYKPVAAASLELVFDRGIGLITGQGSNPQVMMRQSFDGGKTWTNERWRSMGKVGEYLIRAIWSRMGTARDRIIEFSIADPVRRALSYANLADPEAGD